MARRPGSRCRRRQASGAGQEDKGTWPTQHFAFTVEEADIEAAAAALKKRGVAVTRPVLHEWMPASSVYFSDPNGHELELCAPVKKT
ncbi:MAG: hypothetical protein DMF51_13485 [Acidobacteria bacterium]|nr:MAG: hypothetical protein DMF51_13485 [Acidobacteriota bacterium]